LFVNGLLGIRNQFLSAHKSSNPELYEDSHANEPVVADAVLDLLQLLAAGCGPTATSRGDPLKAADEAKNSRAQHSPTKTEFKPTIPASRYRPRLFDVLRFHQVTLDHVRVSNGSHRSTRSKSNRLHRKDVSEAAARLQTKRRTRFTPAA
jgi:hypothetical protein